MTDEAVPESVPPEWEAASRFVDGVFERLPRDHPLELRERIRDELFHAAARAFRCSWEIPNVPPGLEVPLRALGEAIRDNHNAMLFETLLLRAELEQLRWRMEQDGA